MSHSQTAEVRELTQSLREVVRELKEKAEEVPEPPSAVSLADLRAELQGLVTTLSAS